MRWDDELRYAGTVQARFRVAAAAGQHVRASVLAVLGTAAFSRAMDATPPELLAYLATGRAS